MDLKLDLKSKFLGGLVGSALGDAIGELAFRYHDEMSLGAVVEHSNVLTYTDDTAMAIGLAETIVQTGHLDEKHLGDVFKSNFTREPWRGYASGPPELFAMVDEQGLSYTEAAGRLFDGQGSLGNGAAMRIAPVGLFYYDAPDLYAQVRQSSIVTHAHPVGIDGAAVLAYAIARAVSLEPNEVFPSELFSLELVSFAKTAEFRAKMACVKTLLAENAPADEAARQLGRSVMAHESVPFAIYSFLRYPNSFNDCLFCAVLNGGDRDTLGAMACAIAGAYLGIEAIPEAWRARLEKGQYIESLALQLEQMKK